MTAARRVADLSGDGWLGRASRAKKEWQAITDADVLNPNWQTINALSQDPP